MNLPLRVDSNPNSEIRTPKSAAFSLVDMLATVAALVIVLGLAVSLARYVRRQASDQLTKQLLTRLDVLIVRYRARYNALPPVAPFVPVERGVGEETGGEGETRGQGDNETRGPVGEGAGRSIPRPSLFAATLPADDALPPEADLQLSAIANNSAFVAAVRVEARRRGTEFGDLPASFYDDKGGALFDAWGTPIVFMPSMHPAVGMAMENDPFFLSAGPDRQFRTSEDNLYSYEEVGADENPTR